MENESDPLRMLDYIYQEARSIIEEKNHDYRGGSGDPYANFRGSVILDIDPIIGVLLRALDKIMRVKTYVETGKLKVKNEGVKDAVVDVTNYMAIAWGLIQEKLDESIESVEIEEETTGSDYEDEGDISIGLQFRR